MHKGQTLPNIYKSIIRKQFRLLFVNPIHLAFRMAKSKTNDRKLVITRFGG